MLRTIRKLIKEGEGFTVEFKKCKDSLPSSVFETICAFLNRHGGDILLGVDDGGNVTGVKDEAIEQIKKDFASSVNNKQKLSPTFYINLDAYKLNGKYILHAHIPESSQVHRCCGRIYDRNEDGDFDITDNTALVSEMYIRKNNTYTENRIFPFAEMSDLRKDLIARARITAVNARGGGHPWALMSDEELLKSASLISKDMTTGKSGITLACILLFGKDETIMNALPHHRTDAIMRRKDLDRYDDRDDIRTNLLESYDRLCAFAAKHLNDAFSMEGTIRISVRDKIMRELVANCLIHREYSNAFPAKLIIEKDRVYTENANKPIRTGRIDIRDYTPYPKNPVIARVFKEMGYADELGSGIRNIVKYTKIYADTEPVFEEGDIFRTYIFINERLSAADNNTGRPLETESEPKMRPKIRPKIRPKTEPMMRPKTEAVTTEEIILALRERTDASKREIAEMLGQKSISGSLKKSMASLLKEGLIEPTIPDKPRSRYQRYRMTKKGLERSKSAG